MNTTRDYTINSVKKALDILKLYNNEKHELTLSDISALLRVGKSSTLRLLYTLQNEGFIEFDEIKKTYSLGIEMSRLGLMKFNSLDVRKIARPYLQKLSDEMDLICYVGVRQGDQLAMIDQILPSRIPAWAQLTVQSGGISELYSTGIGRLFLSQDKEEEVQEYLDRIQLVKFTDTTITDKKQLMKLVRQAGEQQYSNNAGENETHIYSVCAPIYDQTAKMVAGISICGLQDVMCGNRYELYLKRIRGTASSISRDLGAPKGKWKKMI